MEDCSSSEEENRTTPGRQWPRKEANELELDMGIESTQTAKRDTFRKMRQAMFSGGSLERCSSPEAIQACAGDGGTGKTKAESPTREDPCDLNASIGKTRKRGFVERILSLERRELSGEMDVFNTTQEIWLLQGMINECGKREEAALDRVEELQEKSRQIVEQTDVLERRLRLSMERRRQLERQVASKAACVRSALCRVKIAENLQDSLLATIRSKREELDSVQRKEARNCVRIQRATAQLRQRIVDNNQDSENAIIV